MHILTGIMVSLVGVGLVLGAQALAQFQYRTLMAFNIVRKPNPSHIKLLKYWGILFGIFCIVLGLVIAFHGYL